MDYRRQAVFCKGDEAMVVNCEHVWREVSNYLDGEVAPDLRAAMDEHNPWTRVAPARYVNRSRDAHAAFTLFRTAPILPPSPGVTS